MGVQNLLLTLIALTGLVQAQDCSKDYFPVYAGGSGDEFINCLIYDETTELLIVGGNTTSEDWAPAANDHAFMYALDLDGNWAWGKFFYNVSHAVSSISGCQLSSDGTSVTVLGQGNAQPVIMDINPADGVINSYVSIENTDSSDEFMPSYFTQAAIYNEKVDS